MSPQYLTPLLVIFIIHLLIFGRLALRTGRWDHRCLVVTFVCLCAATALRIWHPSLSLGSVLVWRLFRWSAWGATLLAAFLWLGQRLGIHQR